MPIDVYRNDDIYNMVAEGEIAEILSKFNTSYVMDVIDSTIKNRFAFNPTLNNPNIVNSYELNFKGMLNNFPDDADNIMSIRQETYLTIINKICNSFNMQYIGDNPDCYVLAYNIYDLFISGYARNIINFFARYIYTYKNEIYNNMGLDRYKKSKDSTINYMRKVFDNSSVIDVIIARIRDVIYYISGFDIDFNMFLTSCGMDSHEVKVILSHVIPKSNIYKEKICDVMNYPDLITEIKLSIQSEIIENNKSKIDEITSQYIISNNDNTNKEEL